MPFIDRTDAGRRLAKELRHLRADDAVVVGLPRGGVPVAMEVALDLDAPLDIAIVRKLGVPFHRELGMGAIGEESVTIINSAVVAHARVSARDLAEVEQTERAELDRQVLRFRGNRQRASLAGKTVIIVDDGIATGSTARAACQIVRAQGAQRVVLAVPVAPADLAPQVRHEVDEYVCLEAPVGFIAVGRHYDDFSPTSDREVVACLLRVASRATTAAAEPEAEAAGRESE